MSTTAPNPDDPNNIDWSNPPVSFRDGWVDLPVHPPDRAILGMPGAGKTTTLEAILREVLGLDQNDDVDVDLADDYDTIASGDEPIDRLQNVVVSTFRKSMADDVGERVARLIGEDLPNRHWIRTTHSICYKLLGVEAGQVVTEDDRRDFCADFGVPYRKGSGSNAGAPAWFGITTNGADAELNTTEPVGNQLYDLRSFAINTFRDPETDWRKLGVDIGDLVELNHPNQRIQRFNRDYHAWKVERGLIDFDDMLWMVWKNGICPPADVLIEDEFQDKTPLQLGIYNQWANAAKRVIVAGDPYQSVYSFSGCDPRYLVNAFQGADEQTKLGTSYRYGPSLWNFATPILQDAGYSPWPINPVGDSTVREIDIDDYERMAQEYSDADTMHLGRTNYICSNVIARTLDEAGVPFAETTNQSRPRWTTRMVVLYDAVVTAYNMVDAAQKTFGRPRYDELSVGQAKVLIPAFPADWFNDLTKKSALKKLKKLEPGNDDHRTELARLLRDWFPLGHLIPLVTSKTPFDVLVPSRVAKSQPAYDRMVTTWKTRGAKKIGLVADDDVGTIAELMGQDTINTISARLSNTVSTIHGSKGREADVVFLLDQTSSKIVNEADREEEARVWFVGATRARQTLFVVRSHAKHTFDFPASARQHITGNGTGPDQKQDHEAS